MNFSLFSHFDFNALENPDFDESAVREEIITPILRALNYRSFGNNLIIREKGLYEPYVQIGSGKKKIASIPDYLLKVNGRYAFVLEAKRPDKDIKTGKNVQQARYYAIHPEINVQYYALCNGKEFVLFHVSQKAPLLSFSVKEIKDYWQALKQYLSPDAFAQSDILAERTPTYIYLEKKERYFME